MASTSSRRRSGRSEEGSRDEVAQLLRDGARFRAPSEDLLRVARRLEGLGLVQPQVRDLVRCVDELDRDFSRVRNRPCQGVIYVRADADEAGDEYRCEECNRPVYPDRDRKRRQRELQVVVKVPGVMDYISEGLAPLKVGVREAAAGVLRIDVGDTGVYVCVPEVCRDSRFCPPGWVQNNRTCYLTLGLREGDPLEDGWMARIPLADVLRGEVALMDVIRRLAVAAAPTNPGRMAIPIRAPTPAVVTAPPGKGRRFVVQVGPGTIRVEGVDVVGSRAERQYEIFAVLWGAYLDDLRDGRSLEEFRFLKLGEIAAGAEEKAGGAIGDEPTVRKYVNRLQEGIETAIRKTLGLPIDREDIVQTRPRAGGAGDVYGYRINPQTVWPRPFEGPPT